MGAYFKPMAKSKEDSDFVSYKSKRMGTKFLEYSGHNINDFIYELYYKFKNEPIKLVMACDYDDNTLYDRDDNWEYEMTHKRLNTNKEFLIYDKTKNQLIDLNKIKSFYECFEIIPHPLALLTRKTNEYMGGGDMNLEELKDKNKYNLKYFDYNLIGSWYNDDIQIYHDITKRDLEKMLNKNIDDITEKMLVCEDIFFDKGKSVNKLNDVVPQIEKGTQFLGKWSTSVDEFLNLANEIKKEGYVDFNIGDYNGNITDDKFIKTIYDKILEENKSSNKVIVDTLYDNVVQDIKWNRDYLMSEYQDVLYKLDKIYEHYMLPNEELELLYYGRGDSKTLKTQIINKLTGVYGDDTINRVNQELGKLENINKDLSILNITNTITPEMVLDIFKTRNNQIVDYLEKTYSKSLKQLLTIKNSNIVKWDVTHTYENLESLYGTYLNMKSNKTLENDDKDVSNKQHEL